MVLHNPNNWHWVNKDVSPWTREFLERKLVGLSANDQSAQVRIDKLSKMTGDVDVSQRKGKVITIFDVCLDLEFSGKIKDVGDVRGKITIPEVAHDTEEDDYVFNIEITDDSSKKLPIRNLIRQSIVPQIRKELVQLGPCLIAEHGKDIQHANGMISKPEFIVSQTNTQSFVSRSNPTDSTSKSPSNTKWNNTCSPSVNVTTLSDHVEFRTTAAELFRTFTDPDRLAAFTRSAPSRFDGAKVGGKFELFNGNVLGEFIQLDPPVGLVQRWRLSQWPEGHFSTLTINFDQNNVDSVTTMNVTWDGIPVGQEEITRQNWQEYYVISIKRTFGFGTVL